MKFAVGDRVRVIGSERMGIVRKELEGKEGVIARLDGAYYIVGFDDLVVANVPTTLFTMDHTMLELIEDDDGGDPGDPLIDTARILHERLVAARDAIGTVTDVWNLREMAGAKIPDKQRTLDNLLAETMGWIYNVEEELEPLIESAQIQLEQADPDDENPLADHAINMFEGITLND